MRERQVFRGGKLILTLLQLILALACVRFWHAEWLKHLVCLPLEYLESICLFWTTRLDSTITGTSGSTRMALTIESPYAGGAIIPIFCFWLSTLRILQKSWDLSSNEQP